MISWESSLELAMKQVSQFTPFPSKHAANPPFAAEQEQGRVDLTLLGWDYRVLRGEIITGIKKLVRCQSHLKFMFPYRILVHCQW